MEVVAEVLKPHTGIRCFVEAVGRYHPTKSSVWAPRCSKTDTKKQFTNSKESQMASQLTEEDLRESVQEVLEEGLRRKGIEVSNIRLDILMTDEHPSMVIARFDVK